MFRYPLVGRVFGFFRRVFTLVEMLVVIAIIGILASLLMPSLVKALETARGTLCAGNLRQIFLLQNSYAGDYGWYTPSRNAPEYGPNFSMNWWDMKLSVYFGRKAPTNWAEAIRIWQDPLYWCPSKTEFGSDTRCYAPSGFGCLSWWPQTQLAPSVLVSGTPGIDTAIYMIRPQSRARNSIPPGKILFYGELGHRPATEKLYTHYAIHVVSNLDGTDTMTTADFRHNGLKNSLMLDGHNTVTRPGDFEWQLYMK